MTSQNLELQPDFEAHAGNAPSRNAPSRWRAQWEGYAQYHQSRSNLLLHIFLVPLFVAGNVALVVALAERRWLLALGAVVLTFLSLVMQGRGHRSEAVAPRPFMSPRDAMARILLEQWVTFPRFVLSGAWKQALRRSGSR